MKWSIVLLLAITTLRADYAAWFGITPPFRYENSDKRPSTLTVEWSPGVTWPDTAPRYMRLPNPLPKERLDKLLESFGKGPWSVYVEANDGKGFVVLARRGNEETAGTEISGEGKPHLLTPDERIEKAKALLASIGYPVDTLLTRRRRVWVESEGTPGKETDVAAGVDMSATVGGYRLCPVSAYSASVGFDRYSRPTEVRLVWRKTKIDGEFKLATKAQAEAAILGGKARTKHFGFAQQLGLSATPEQRAIEQAIQTEATQAAALGLPPPVVKRRAVITGAELVLLDYASNEGIYGDEQADFGHFDDVLWPALVFKVELTTGDKTERGTLTLSADADWFREPAPPAGIRLGPPARGRSDSISVCTKTLQRYPFPIPGRGIL